MQTTTSRTRKPERRISVIAREGETLLLEIADGKAPQPTYYFCTPMPSDWGAAFRVEKQDAVGTAETYDVLIDPKASICSCPGFLFHSRDCRHIAGLKALAVRGSLPGIPRKFGLVEVGGKFRPGRDDEPRSQPFYRSAGDYACNDPVGWERHCLDIEGGDHAA